MKLLILMITFCIASTAFASEVETPCIAMNENREKVIKTLKPKASNTKKGSSQQ
jgi:hypothetical protein